MRFLLILFILSCSVFFWIGKELRVAQELYYEMGGISLILACLLFFDIKPIKRTKISLWVGILGLYGAFLMFFHNKNYGNAVYLNLVIGILIYFVTLQLKQEHTKFMLWAVLWVCVGNMLHMAIQALGMDFIYTIRGFPGTIDLCGLFGLKAAMGMWMGLGMVAVLFQNPWLAIGFALPLYISKASAVWLGSCIAVPFWLYYTKRLAFKIVTPLLLIGAVVYVIYVDAPMGMLSSRPPMWKMVCEDTVKGFPVIHPWRGLVGYGLDSFRFGQVLYMKKAENDVTIRGIKIPNRMLTIDGRDFFKKDGHIYSPDCERMDVWDNPHCSIVYIFHSMGLGGLVIFGFIFYYMVKRFRRSLKSRELVTVTAMIIFLLGCGTGQFPEGLARIGFMFPILLGLFVVNSK